MSAPAYALKLADVAIRAYESSRVYSISSVAAAIAEHVGPLVEALEEIGGFDCKNATAQSMSLAPGDTAPCGRCVTCIARAALDKLEGK